MPQALVISWAFPPVLSARSIQVGRTLKGLVRLGWGIHIITVDPYSLDKLVQLDLGLEELYVQGLNVHRVPSSWLRPFAVFRRRFTPAIMPLPDNEIKWVRMAYKAGMKLRSQIPFDALLSFGQPWSSHLAAQELQDASGLPWAAHFSDPWADNPYHAKLNPRQHQRMSRMESAVIKAADQILFTNKQTLGLVMSKYPAHWKQKASVLPHSYEKNTFRNPKHGSDDKRLKLVYTGSLYGLRNPRTLLEALGQMQLKEDISKRLTVQFIGPIKNQLKYQAQLNRLGLSKVVEFLGNKDYRETQEHAASADVLLVIDAQTENENLFLPSKLVDYLAYEKPILGITPVKGATADLLRSIGCPIAPPENVEAIRFEIEKLLSAWQAGDLRISAQFRKEMKRYETKEISSQLSKLLKEMISNKRVIVEPTK